MSARSPIAPRPAVAPLPRTVATRPVPAMVLGAGQLLAGEGGFGGAVHLVFQPAEEHGLSQPRGRLATPGGRNR